MNPITLTDRKGVLFTHLLTPFSMPISLASESEASETGIEKG